MTDETLSDLLASVRQCRLCETHLPLGPRPVLQAGEEAVLMIIGQAPGTKVHETGVPWNDPSGDRLRDWLQVDRETFYDANRIALTPMGFCYPGRYPRGGDLPPRVECAPAWHERLRARMPKIALTLLVGSYAQARYLGPARGKTLTETVRDFRTHLAHGFLPTPHPSWRVNGWLKKNTWFEEEVLPELRRQVQAIL